jgi:hypothetical protein
VALYSKTVPNLNSTNAVNDAILAMTLKIIANGYKSKMQNMAQSKVDVSRFRGDYQRIMDKVQSLNQSALILESNNTTPPPRSGKGRVK